MTIVTTPHIGISLLDQNMASKEIMINEGFYRIDALLNNGALDKDLATPPGSPATGDTYIIAASPTGAWSGKAGNVTYFDQVWQFIPPNAGLLVWVRDEAKYYYYDGTSWSILSLGGGSTTSFPQDGRVTLTSATPVTTSDVTAATTLYFTPHKGNRIALYASSAWTTLAFSETTLTVPATTNTMYDLFAYNSSGTLALETLAWTNDTTRATGLGRQDGVLVKSGDATRRYLGSFRTTGTSGKTEDSKVKRYVWNYYNRTARELYVADTATSWNYSTAIFRQANANSANQVDFVIGVAEDTCELGLTYCAATSAATIRRVYGGIGIDSISAPLRGQTSIPANSSVIFNGYASLRTVVAAGHHYAAWLEAGGGTDTQTFYSAGGSYGWLEGLITG